MSPKESRVRFIPLENSSLFALNRPFHAVIRNTKDPKIKKLVLLDAEGANADQEVVNTVLSKAAFEAVKHLARQNQTSVSAVIENIVEQHISLDATAMVPGGPPGNAPARVSAARAARLAALEGQPTTHRPPGQREGHGPAGPVDFIISNIVEASVLILDGLQEEKDRLPAGKREETFDLIHHALRTLMRLKRGEDGGFFTESGKQRLLSLMKDLDHFRSIADEEERALLPEDDTSTADSGTRRPPAREATHRKPAK